MRKEEKLTMCINIDRSTFSITREGKMAGLKSLTGAKGACLAVLMLSMALCGAAEAASSQEQVKATSHHRLDPVDLLRGTSSNGDGGEAATKNWRLSSSSAPQRSESGFFAWNPLANMKGKPYAKQVEEFVEDRPQLNEKPNGGLQDCEGVPFISPPVELAQKFSFYVLPAENFFVKLGRSLFGGEAPQVTELSQPQDLCKAGEEVVQAYGNFSMTLYEVLEGDEVTQVPD